MIAVGELNPHGGPALNPRTPSGSRLLKILGAGAYAGLRRTNLCRGRWDRARARQRALLIARRGGPIVLLGTRVAAAFGVPYRPFRRDGRLLVLPHPSGLCRAWNDPQSAPRARRALRRLELWYDRGLRRR